MLNGKETKNNMTIAFACQRKKKDRSKMEVKRGVRGNTEYAPTIVC